jgi:hypothetical protein
VSGRHGKRSRRSQCKQRDTGEKTRMGGCGPAPDFPFPWCSGGREGGSHACPWGMVECRGHGRDAGPGRNARPCENACRLFFCEKKRQLVFVAIYSAGVYNQYTAKHKHKHKLCLAESDWTRLWTRLRPADRVGPARAGSDRDGRKRQAADGRAGPFRSEKTPFFPSHSVPTGLRSITGRTIQFFPESERTSPPPVGGRTRQSRTLPGRGGGGRGRCVR